MKKSPEEIFASIFDKNASMEKIAVREHAFMRHIGHAVCAVLSRQPQATCEDLAAELRQKIAECPESPVHGFTLPALRGALAHIEALRKKP